MVTLGRETLRESDAARLLTTEALAAVSGSGTATCSTVITGKMRRATSGISMEGQSSAAFRKIADAAVCDTDANLRAAGLGFSTALSGTGIVWGLGAVRELRLYSTTKVFVGRMVAIVRGECALHSTVQRKDESIIVQIALHLSCILDKAAAGAGWLEENAA